MPPLTRWPGGPGFTFAEAVAHLDALPKPVFVGALNHLGVVAVWPKSGLTLAESDYLNRLVVNQVAALEEMLPELDGPGATTILFDSGVDKVTVSRDDFKVWLGDYGLTWGWRLGIATDAEHRAQLFVLKDGRQWSPGETCRPPDAT